MGNNSIYAVIAGGKAIGTYISKVQAEEHAEGHGVVEITLSQNVCATIYAAMRRTDIEEEARIYFRDNIWEYAAANKWDKPTFEEVEQEFVERWVDEWDYGESVDLDERKGYLLDNLVEEYDEEDEEDEEV